MRRLEQGDERALLLWVMGRVPDGLFFELGLRPRAPPLVCYRSGDVAGVLSPP